MTAKPLLDAFRDYISLRTEDIVQDWFSDFDWNLSERNLEATSLPVTEYLPDTLALAKPAEARLVSALVAQAKYLKWGQSYTAEDFGEDFIQNYGYMELAGTRGHFVNDRIAFGFVLFGPDTTYPQHWHVAEECYFPMTSGSFWSRDAGEYIPRQSGEFIFHESNMTHSMRTEGAPLLAVYVWQGGDLAQKSDF